MGNRLWKEMLGNSILVLIERMATVTIRRGNIDVFIQLFTK